MRSWIRTVWINSRFATDTRFEWKRTIASPRLLGWLWSSRGKRTWQCWRGSHWPVRFRSCSRWSLSNQTKIPSWGTSMRAPWWFLRNCPRIGCMQRLPWAPRRSRWWVRRQWCHCRAPWSLGCCSRRRWTPMSGRWRRCWWWWSPAWRCALRFWAARSARTALHLFTHYA